MPNPITTGLAGAHRTHAEVSADAPPRTSAPSTNTIEHKTREGLRLAWDLSLNFYETVDGVRGAKCVDCGMARATVVTAHKENCKVGRFERLSREVLTRYVEA